MRHAPRPDGVIAASAQLASATVAAGTVSYLVNGLEQRVLKSGPTALVAIGVAYFAYDELARGVAAAAPGVGDDEGLGRGAVADGLRLAEHAAKAIVGLGGAARFVAVNHINDLARSRSKRITDSVLPTWSKKRGAT